MALFPCNVGSGGTSKVKLGTFTPTSTGQTVVSDIGFKPKYLAIWCYKTNNTFGTMYIYDERYSTTKFVMAQSDGTWNNANLGTASNYYLFSIDNSGFTLNKFYNSAWAGVSYYFAIG